ncbi:MAG: von Willebrand factor type [Chthoniobacteraceae bacterium]|nr:von Willebrand factor type [Chthoniobacteraceae bacterium]
MIVLLYLLKVKRRQIPVSTLMFWQRVLQENRQRALFHRLRNLLSLLLHLLIFLLILTALAKPTLDAFLAAGSDTVLIVDTRARMQAVEDDGESRFDRARRLAAPYVSQANRRSQVALIFAGAAADVAVPFTGDVKPLEAALKAASATDATGNLDSAVHLAQTLLSSRKGRHRIVVLTSTPRSDTQPVVYLDSANAAYEPAVSYAFTGTARDNVAITRFSTRPLLNSPQTSEVLLEIRNFGTAPVKGNVELSLDGRRLEIKPFEIEAGGRKLDFFPILPRTERSARGWLKAQLDTADALPLDNTAYALVPTPQPARLLLVTKGNWFLEKLLAADLQLRFELLTPDAFTLPMAEKFDAVLFDNVLPAEFAFGKTAGNFLFFKQTPFTASGPSLEQPILTEIDNQHPLLRLVDLQNLTIVRASPMRLPSEAPEWTFQTPLRAFDEPVLIAGSRRTTTPPGEQRVVALGFDVAESDLPLRIAFPLLISNAVHWLAHESTPLPRSISTGETLALDPGQNVSTEPETDFPAKPGAMARAFFQPSRQGYYRLDPPAPGGANWVAVNMFSEAESDLRATATQVAATTPTAVAMPMMQRPLWQYLAIAALLLSTMEWFLFHRRRTE